MAAKSSTAKKASSKSTGAKKGAARKSADASASDKRKRSAKKGGRRKDPPPPSFWLTGTLGVENGVIGMKRTNAPFIPMADAVAGGHMVTLVFQPAAGSKVAEVQDMLQKLGEFFEAFGVATIPCGYTCCGGP